MQPSVNPSNLPMPLKVAFLLATGTGLGVVARELSRTSSTALWVVTVGIVLIVCATAAVGLAQRLLRKRQSERFAKAMAPGKVAGGGTAQVRAQREDLRRRFVEGVQKLRDHGIDCYELPWYVVVGESGGGKTELLRRCGAAGAASHGMTDPLQGVGGTLNMNWWFYNRAVILDTAGRLWEDQENAASLSEWEEFLRLLVRYRRATPINGLILVIPATSLLRDRADEIDAKTATIVSQLHRVRNALEVRFPVYVVVSKCDLIPGFREFFDHINQPDLQHQILGWSNRHDLDEPIQLDAPVEEAAAGDGPRQTLLTRELNQIADRLALRRLALLRDPTPASPSGRRLDDVDGVFAFPEQFRQRIIPAVSHYVTRIFAAGRYDRKPLFLRGIYFTSSMREGSPLDEDLARMLGKDLDRLAAEESLPREERAYFLTDLFDQKIFREPGLVSRSVTPRRQLRRYRAALAGAALAGLVALFTVTLLASRRFAAGLGGDLALWRVAADACAGAAGGEAGRGDIPVVKPAAAASADYVYAGEVEAGPSRERLSIAAYHRRLRDTLGHEIRVPLVLRPFVKPAALDADRREAQALFFHTRVVVPLVEAARNRLVQMGRDAPAGTPVPAAVPAATAALLRLELCEPPGAGADARAGRAPLTEADFDALMALVLVEGSDPWRRYAEKDPARADLKTLFAEHLQESGLWAGLRLGLQVDGDRLAANAPIAAGVELVLRGHCTPAVLREAEPSLAVFAELAGLVSAWDDAEAGLLAVAAPLGADREDWLQGVSPDSVPDTQAGWRKAHEVFVASTGTVQRLLGRLGGELPADPAQRYNDAVKGAVGKARARVRDQVLAGLGVGPGAAGPPAPDPFVQWLEKRIEERFVENAAALADENLAAAMERLGTRFLGTVPLAVPAGAGARVRAAAAALGGSPALFQVRQALYAESRLAPGLAPEGAPAAEGVDAGELAAVIAWLGSAAPAGYRVKEAAQASRAMVELSVAYRNTLTARQALEDVPRNAGAVMDRVRKRPEASPRKPLIPFTGMQGGAFDPAFSPVALKAVLAEWQSRRDALQRLTPVLGRAALLAALAEAENGYAQYLGPFTDYWLREMPSGLEVSPFADWRTAQRAAGQAKAWEICSGFEDVCRVLQALKDAGLGDLVREERTAQRWQALAAEGEAVLRHVTSRPFVDQCDAVLRRWAQLPEEPDAARQALLPLRTADFERDYFVFAPGATDTFLHRYWGGLSRGFLSALTQDSSAALDPLIAGLRPYQRWPLNLPGAGASLSLDDLNAARPLLQRLALRPGDFPAGSIGAGAGAQDPALDRLLKGLGRVPLPADDAAWLERATAVAKLIPANARLQRTCKVQFAPPSAGDAFPFSRFWTWVVVRQGGRDITQLNTADTAASFDLVWHPGDAVEMAFFRFPNDTDPDKVLALPGPWAPLRLPVEAPEGGGQRSYGPGKPILEGGVEGAPAAARWLVPVVFSDPQGNRRELGLVLTFDQAIPVDWPVK